MVELLARYSKLSDARRSLDRAHAVLAACTAEPLPPTDEPRIYRAIDRLTPAELEELLGAYRRGASAKKLAQQFEMSRNSVLAIVTQAGIARQQTRMTADDETEAVRLYVEQRWSLSRIGEHLGRDTTTILNVMKRHGVPRRPQGGGRR